MTESESRRPGEPQVLLRMLEVPDMAFTGTALEAETWQLRTDEAEKRSPAEVELVASKPGQICLGGLFDSFFDSFWSRYTALKAVYLQCRIHGDVEVTVLRRDAVSGAETCLAIVSTQASLRTDQSGRNIEISLPLPEPDARESRLIVKFDAREPGARVVAPCWITREEPVREPRLGLVITTFNREQFVKRNLQRLSGRLATARLIVVNHGTPGLRERMASAVLSGDEVRFIDQENSGGAGGFTRGMEEHLAAGDVTHIMLMDDDIDLPRDLALRATAVLAYAHAQLCLGGSMFDFHERGKLFSAGDVLLPGSFGIAHIAPEKGCDINEAAGVDFLARVHPVDFNGWWCFAFPVEAMMTAGLPMPCFIRGDDVEYGYRLKRSGWPTLAWPGLAVWHMPFDAKAAAWHSFYDRRNALFANTIHKRVGRVAALGKLIGGFVLHLLRYDYARVEAMTRGIAAFNQGADAMKRWSHRDHAALVASVAPAQIVTGHGPAARHGAFATIAPQPLRGAMRTFTMATRFAADLLWPWRRTQPVSLAPGMAWRGDMMQRPAHVVEIDALGQPLAIYRYHWRSSWAATGRCLIALLGLIWHFHQPMPLRYPGRTI